MPFSGGGLNLDVHVMKNNTSRATDLLNAHSAAGRLGFVNESEYMNISGGLGSLQAFLNHGGVTAVANRNAAAGIAPPPPNPVITPVAPVPAGTTSFTLDASQSTDQSGIAAYNWSQIGGPNQATFSSTTGPTITVTGFVPGTYSFQLTLTNTGGVTVTAGIAVVVQGSAAADTSGTQAPAPPAVVNEVVVPPAGAAAAAAAATTPGTAASGAPAAGSIVSPSPMPLPAVPTVSFLQQYGVAIGVVLVILIVVGVAVKKGSHKQPTGTPILEESEPGYIIRHNPGRHQPNRIRPRNI